MIATVDEGAVTVMTRSAGKGKEGQGRAGHQIERLLALETLRAVVDATERIGMETGT